MNRIFIAIASVCIVISVIAPIAIYTYYNKIIESNKLQILDIQQENENLKEEIKKIEQTRYIMKSYLVTNLGWYLHNSSDPVPGSRNMFTIYGTVLNIGATTATNCKLIINFYDNKTLLQTSEIYIGNGKISYWSYTGVSQTIHCDSADSVNRIEVTPKWS